MTIPGECYICKKTFKTRVGLYYVRPAVIREKIDQNYKGPITEMNKEELGFFLCKKHAIENKV